MNASRPLSALIRSLTATVLLGCTAMALAAEPATSPTVPSKEMREKMATAHANMAACLRSDKPFADCQQQMHRHCAEMGEQGCPMMGMGPHNRAMMPPKQE